MKAILFILMMCGFYYGMNQYALSEDAITRWIKESHFLDQASADKFCSAIGPLTEVHYTYTKNGLHPQIAADSADELCPYWKKQIFPNAKWADSNLDISNLNIDKIQKFPFNSAKVSYDIKTSTYKENLIPDPNNYGEKIKKRERYEIVRHEEIFFKRDLLGNYHFISFNGYENLLYPKEVRQF